jgi:hypothetical protein
MKRLREAVRRKRPEAWTNKTWMLHRENTPPHASLPGRVPELEKRWERCINSRGEYFEGDKSD